jgi:hypothetical protein
MPKVIEGKLISKGKKYETDDSSFKKVNYK